MVAGPEIERRDWHCAIKLPDPSVICDAWSFSWFLLSFLPDSVAKYVFPFDTLRIVSRRVCTLFRL